uniref:DUF4116 domain-containing protein n=1 Tax=Pfiesteria piscicida TaxID=71001 RepID=A3E3S5_PFIPI|nr:unknown [Pfiesteria piscicida]
MGNRVAQHRRCAAKEAVALQSSSAPSTVDPLGAAAGDLIVEECVLQAIEHDAAVLQRVPHRLLEDPSFMLEAVSRNVIAAAFAHQKLLGDPSFVVAAAHLCAGSFLFADGSLCTDRDFMLEVVRHFGGLLLARASAELLHDRELVFEAAIRNGHSFRLAAFELKCDAALVLDIVQRQPCAWLYADDRLRRSRVCTREVLCRNPAVVAYIVPEFVGAILDDADGDFVVLHDEERQLPFFDNVACSSTSAFSVGMPDHRTTLRFTVFYDGDVPSTYEVDVDPECVDVQGDTALPLACASL